MLNDEGVNIALQKVITMGIHKSVLISTKERCNIPYEPAIPILGISPKEECIHLLQHVQECSQQLSHINQIMETTQELVQTSTVEWINCDAVM